MATNQLQCPLCDATFDVDPVFANQRIDCPGCRQQIMVPASVAATPLVDATPGRGESASPAAAPLSYQCIQCAQVFGVLPEMDGQAVRCPHCGATSRIDLTAASHQPPGLFIAPRDDSVDEQIDDDHADLFPPGYQYESTELRRQSADEEEQPSQETVSSELPPGPQAAHDPNREALSSDTSADAASGEQAAGQSAATKEPAKDLLVARLLPPGFSAALDGPGSGPQTTADGVVLLPDGVGGYQRVDQRITHVQHQGRSVEILSLGRVEKERRRKLRGIIVFGICLVTLVVTFVLLTRYIQ